MVILREIQADGYTGEETLVRQYIQPKRVLRPAGLRCASRPSPGEQLQTDWGEVVVEIAGQLDQGVFHRQHAGLFAAVSLLVHRQPGCRAHLRRPDPQLRVLRRGDRRKCWSTTRRAPCIQASNQGKPQFNERFLDLASHYGFTPTRLPTVSGAHQGQG